MERNSTIALQCQREEEGVDSFKLVAQNSIYMSNRCDISFCKRGVEPHFLITHNGVRFEHGMKHSRSSPLSRRRFGQRDRELPCRNMHLMSVARILSAYAKEIHKGGQ